MDNKKIIIFIILLISLSCTKVNYIVIDNIPQTPVLTVFPASMSKEDINAANRITELILSCGVKTIERPVMLKERSDFEGATTGGGVGITGSGNLSLLSGGATQSAELRSSIDPVGLIKETNADYIFIVNNKAGNPYIKLIKRESEQILYAGEIVIESHSTCCLNIFPSYGINPRQHMWNLLEKAGIIK
ncbi:MAG: hypothetical protein KGZ86_03965 [Candidatus Latescibacteria bacterium]|nr:hypothetical protein [Candidatus Latescibacterota bacterium]